MPTISYTFRLLGVVALLAAALPVPAQVDEFQPLTPPPEAASSTIETPEIWFVELATPPSVEGTPAATLAAEKNAFRAAARAAGVRYSERMAFGTLWNGLSVRVDPGDLGKLLRLPGVSAIYPMTQIPLPTTETVYEPELLTALSLTGADIAQSSLDLSGAGVRVGIIDTGVDLDHPDLGGSGVNGGTSFPSSRIVAGYDFVGDAFTGTNTPQPDDNPDDCYGHGTHVAGIIGANGTVKGVAPGVVFGAYRVGGCSGNTTSDILIAAMERALADGMRVVNMSIGSAFGWPQYPEAQAAKRLVDQGIVVVASTGNEGSYGLYAAAAPAVGEKVIGVASFNNSYINHTPAFSITPDNRLVGYFRASGAPAPPLSGTFPLARTGLPTSPSDACTALTPASLLGKVALINASGCTYYTKTRNARTAGAAGVIIYGPNLSISVSGSPAISIPVVAIALVDGLEINNRIASGAASMTWTNEFTSVPAPYGGLISSYSSWGLTADLDLKPDIGAPGGYIYSTYPLEKGGYTGMSGTSMASPHVVGAVALLLEAKPRTPSQAVREILQNSAVPKPF
jgi:subtilisin family serine protease